MMSGIKGKNSKPELIVRRALFAAGFRFRLHRRDLPGSPDIVMHGRKIAIFVHGCFWHLHEGCSDSKLPSTRPAFWKTKLEANAQRDRRASEKLNLMGWRVLWVWECSTRHAESADALQDDLTTWIHGAATFGEISGSKPR
jgi:DNA mismatch endonuclease (patch repair protein)